MKYDREHCSIDEHIDRCYKLAENNYNPKVTKSNLRVAHWLEELKGYRECKEILSSWKHSKRDIESITISGDYDELMKVLTFNRCIDMLLELINMKINNSENSTIESDDIEIENLDDLFTKMIKSTNCEGCSHKKTWEITEMPSIESYEEFENVHNGLKYINENFYCDLSKETICEGTCLECPNYEYSCEQSMRFLESRVGATNLLKSILDDASERLGIPYVED